MRICLYTMHRMETIGDMVAITRPNKLAYCERHGYAYHEEEWTKAIFPGFERLPALIRLLKSGQYDWVFWLGADALITNPSVKLESLIDANAGIIIATDAYQVQMDSFLVQQNLGGLALLNRVWELRDRPIGKFMEQSTLEYIMWQPEFLDTVKLVPQRTLNAYKYSLYGDLGKRYTDATDCLGNNGEWQPGDFIFHVPGRPLETKLKALREVIGRINFELVYFNQTRNEAS